MLGRSAAGQQGRKPRFDRTHVRKPARNRRAGPASLSSRPLGQSPTALARAGPRAFARATFEEDT